MYREEINILRKIVHQVDFIYKIIERCTVNKTLKKKTLLTFYAPEGCHEASSVLLTQTLRTIVTWCPGVCASFEVGTVDVKTYKNNKKGNKIENKHGIQRLKRYDLAKFGDYFLHDRVQHLRRPESSASSV